MRALSRWRACPVAGELAATAGGKAYCHLCQSAFQGALAALRLGEEAGAPAEAPAMGCDFCELASWVGPSRGERQLS